MHRGGVLHDLNVASHHADRIVAMKDGVVVADVAPRDVLTPEVLRKVFDHHVDVVEVAGRPVAMHFAGALTAPTVGPGGRLMAAFCGTVVRTQGLTPHRVVLGGQALQGWTPNEFSDAYLMLWFPPPGAPYAAPFDVDAVKAAHPPELWPLHRDYTVRHFDPASGELAIDFVAHGDQGVAGPWAVRAQPGDRVVLPLPGGAYRPAPDADCHLVVGDESALPAIAASLELVPAWSQAIAVIVCDGPEDELALQCPGELEVRWLHRRGEAADADLLVHAVRALDWPAGRVDAFAQGEAGDVRQVRRHLLADRGLDRGTCRPTTTGDATSSMRSGAPPSGSGASR